MKKFALVTGASGGIGQAVCRELARNGYSLYLHYNQNAAPIESLLQEFAAYGGEYIPIQADLSESGGYKKIAADIFSLDEIVITSGTAHYGLFTDITAQDAENMMYVHATAPMLLTKELLPKLITKGSGSITIISSIWGQTGSACEVLYSAAKGAQIAFVKALSKELALSGVRVNTVAPGAISTNMMSGFSEEDIADIQEDIPMGRLGTAQNIADAVQFLLSEKASYITGQVIAVNGGWYT
ncbi:elongation factor P 5-aminopentanone reductase [Cytobacillus gottheilii]|uniref:SDR family oxidoreductase n=1 Tax=Cytobacillus gottheilii TaxID=859144 RepID=A0ABX8FH75_9BACI|nr:SDR family oxidoreductase [Cytobacillus gottheilii]QVY63356.1 SDR family oxidoreductase [Cytobacillus gottheilii]